jgi:hypothetical protein
MAYFKVYVATVAEGKDVGKMNGIFLSIYGNNFIIGTIVTGFILKHSNLSITAVLWILTGNKYQGSN